MINNVIVHRDAFIVRQIQPACIIALKDRDAVGRAGGSVGDVFEDVARIIEAVRGDGRACTVDDTAAGLGGDLFVGWEQGCGCCSEDASIVGAVIGHGERIGFVLGRWSEARRWREREFDAAALRRAHWCTMEAFRMRLVALMVRRPRDQTRLVAGSSSP